MFQSILVSAIVKAVLQWLKSLVDSWIEKQKAVEQGRQEVLKKLEDKEREQDNALKELGNTRPTDDDFANELRDGYNHFEKKKYTALVITDKSGKYLVKD